MLIIAAKERKEHKGRDERLKGLTADFADGRRFILGVGTFLPATPGGGSPITLE